MFFIPCSNWKTLFLTEACRYFEILSTSIFLLSFFFESALKEVHILRISTPQCSANNGEVLIPKFKTKLPYTKLTLDKLL